MSVADAPQAESEQLTITIERSDDGWYAARIEQIPEAFGQGRTPEAARRDVLSALHDLVYEPTLPERVLYQLRSWRADLRDLLPTR
jgi:predicted RNase H-like HicB family nuclease